MTTATLNRETNTYWNLLRNASKEVKVALIARLSSSLIADPVSCKAKALDFAGMWDDAHFADADEMVEEIRSARKFRHRSVVS